LKCFDPKISVSCFLVVILHKKIFFKVHSFFQFFFQTKKHKNRKTEKKKEQACF
jgi:hypothetical protein